MDLIIFSGVRSEGLGFLTDKRRINVALSRAKYGLWVIANESCLSKFRLWKNFAEHCRNKGRFVSCNHFKDMLNLI